MPPRPRTRAQNNISRPKQFTDGTLHYDVTKCAFAMAKFTTGDVTELRSHVETMQHP